MAHNKKKLTYEEMQKELLKAVWADKNLRKKIALHPKEEVENIIGVKFPSNINVKVIDQTEGCIYFILPRNPSEEFGFELTDNQLDQIAGGITDRKLSTNFDIFQKHINIPKKDVD